MYKLSYGLFILTAKEAEKDNGCQHCFYRLQIMRKNMQRCGLRN